VCVCVQVLDIRNFETGEYALVIPR